MSKSWTKHFEAWISGLDFVPSATEAFRAGWRANDPSLPTREQIAEAIEDAMRQVSFTGLNPEFGPGSVYEATADAVLTLLQKGADR